MFRTRLLSGILLVLAVFLVISRGGILLYAVVAAVSFIGMRELYQAMKAYPDGVRSDNDSSQQAEILELAGYAGALLYNAALWFGVQEYGMLAVITALMLLMFA